jgi:hypothetical protein
MPMRTVGSGFCAQAAVLVDNIANNPKRANCFILALLARGAVVAVSGEACQAKNLRHRVDRRMRFDYGRQRSTIVSKF